MKVIDIALNEVGYIEKASNKDLDSKTANAGNKNYTKYARDLDNIPDFYNGKKQGYAWCEVFADWCFVQAYGAEEAKRMLFQPDKSSGAGCTASCNYYKKAGRFFKDPKVGDQIYFQSGPSIVHTGIVVEVNGKTVTTVEGNTSGTSGVINNGGMVCKKSYSTAYGGIYGYGRPDYKEEDEIVKLTLNKLKKGDKGTQVQAMQQLLIAKGFSCGSYADDGSFGGETLKAVKAFQKAHKLTEDGIVEQFTWGELLGI